MKKNRKVSVPRGSQIKMSREEKLYQACIAIVVGFVTVACILPLLYVVGMSLPSEGEMIEKTFFVIIPEHPTLAAYKNLFSSANFFDGMKITILRTFIGIFSALVLTVPVGYILAIKELPFKNPILLYFITTMLIGGGTIPSYLLYRDLHLLNSFWVYIAPSLANTHGILVVKLFVEGIPTDLMESADLDGASELQKMWHLGIPLLRPTILALGLFAAVAHWNSWMDVMIYAPMNTKIWPIQYIIRNMMLAASTSMDNGIPISSFMKMTPEGFKMAGVLVAVLPILCVYPFLQKYFVKGMFTGSVKG